MWMDPEAAGNVDVEGGRVWWRTNGSAHSDRATLLAVAGGPGMSHHYLTPLLAISDERPVTLYDQLDTGNADHPGDATNRRIKRFVDEVARLRRALGLERIILFGHSWGAMVALEYMLAGANGVVGLVLASPPISIRRWSADAKALVTTLPQDIQAAITDAEESGDYGGETYAAPSGSLAGDIFAARNPARTACFARSQSSLASSTTR